MLESMFDLYIVSIPPPRDHDWHGNDLTSNPHGDNLTFCFVTLSTMFHVSVTNRCECYYLLRFVHYLVLTWINYTQNVYICILLVIACLQQTFLMLFNYYC